MTWNKNRVLHLVGGIAAFIVGIGPQLLPVIPPAWGAGLGVVIALASNLDKVLGRVPAVPAGQAPTS